jgi:hypothetical protein
MPLTKEILNKYKQNIFIETGTHGGDGIAIALATGFNKLYSIEIIPNKYDGCVARFAQEPKVKLYLGDSREILPVILKEIDEPATFWLDAHFGTVEQCIEEIDIIGQHHLKNHTILIDDVRVFPSSSITLEQVQQHLHAINKNYQFILEDNYIAPQDILVAIL